MKFRKKKPKDEGTEKKESDYKAERRSAAGRHTLKLELDAPDYVLDRLFSEDDHLRIAGNQVAYEMNKRIGCLQRDKEYQARYSIYRREAGKLAELEKLGLDPESKEYKQQKAVREAAREAAFKPVAEMLLDYGIATPNAYRIINSAAEGTGLNSVLLQTRAEDIMDGAFTVLFKDGQQLHQLKKGELPMMRAKQPRSAILIGQNNGQLEISMKLPALHRTVVKKFDKAVARENRRRQKINQSNQDAKLDVPDLPPMSQAEQQALKEELKANTREMFSFGVKIKKGDRFAEEELQKLVEFLQHPELEDQAIERYRLTKDPSNLFRPCYAGISCEVIRGKRRAFVHICLEGKPLPKYDKHGNPRHTLGKGDMGVDLGPQSVASTTEQDTRVENLAERDHRSTRLSERKEKKIQRYMDRSRRAMNPEYYNSNGTIKKGKKRWKESKGYRKAKEYLRNLRRKNADSRHCAINEMVHKMRERADRIFIEEKNVKSMMKRAKPEQKTQNQKTASAPKKSYVKKDPAGQAASSKGRSSTCKYKRAHPKKKRRKRFGKSILNRCPGYFFDTLQKRFLETGGQFIVVDHKFRASQYDHCAKDYIKKQLGDRMFKLANGRQVQRDMYSSFLLFCANADCSAPDQALCEARFKRYFRHQKAWFRTVKKNHWKICNSGIIID